MKHKIQTVSILFVGLILFAPLVMAGAGDINIPPTNPPFAEPVSEEILDKINQYVIDYSGIYEYYFNSHYEILNAYKTSFYGEDENACVEIEFAYEYNLEECEDYFAVQVLWKFNVADYSDVIVGSQSGASIYVEEPGRFIFIFKNNEIVDSRSSMYSSNPIPKFREIIDMYSPDQLNSWIEECGEFTRPYGLKLTQKSSDSNALSFIYYSWGNSKDKGNVEFFADLETGEHYCNEILLTGQPKAGVYPPRFNPFANFTTLIFTLVVLIVILAIIIALYKKFKK